MVVGFLFLVAEGIGFGQLREQAEEEGARRDHTQPASMDTLAGPRSAPAVPIPSDRGEQHGCCAEEWRVDSDRTSPR